MTTKIVDVDKIQDRIHEIFLRIGAMAYMEGRQHQFEEDFPDVGMELTKTFEDTAIYEELIKRKYEHERNFR